VEAVGFEPTYTCLRGRPPAARTHFRFAHCWAAIPRGFEPPISSVTGRRPQPLGHGTVIGQQACQESNPSARVLEAPRRTHRLHACDVNQLPVRESNPRRLRVKQAFWPLK
jgi:hypothetical protein